jgi:regulatory protein
MKSDLPKYSGEELYARILAWTDRQERSEHQVLNKLSSWGIPSKEQKKLLERLKRSAAVDDERFASAYVSDAFRFKNWGRIKIDQKLQAAGVEGSIRQKSLAEISSADYREKIETLIAQAIQKKHSLKDYPSRMKLASYIARKGFEADEIFRVFDDYQG